MDQSLPRIYHDFNKLDAGSNEALTGAPLVCRGTKIDLEEKKIELKDGMKVILYQEDDVDSEGNPDFLEVEATVRKKDGGRYFSADFVYSELMYRSERNKIQPDVSSNS